MKFRSPSPDYDIRVALLSGHTEIIGREWQEIHPMFQSEAMAKGCQCDAPYYEQQTRIEGTPEAMNRQFTVDDLYRKTLTEMLARSEEGDFTVDDLPNITVVSSLAGFGARKEDVLRVFREMQAEAGITDPKDDDDTQPEA